jgi:hypothetical protein
MAMLVRSRGRDACLLRIFQHSHFLLECSPSLEFEHSKKGIASRQVCSFTFQMTLAISLLITELAPIQPIQHDRSTKGLLPHPPKGQPPNIHRGKLWLIVKLRRKQPRSELESVFGFGWFQEGLGFMRSGPAMTIARARAAMRNTRLA